MSSPARSAASSVASFAWYYRPLEWLLLALSRLPMAVLYKVSYGLYLLLAYVVRYRRKVVLTNLRNSFPEKTEAAIEELAHQFYRHFADLMVEILKLATTSQQELRQHISMRNPEVVERHIARGRTVIILASHAGNWEWSLALGTLMFSTGADGVYKPLSNPFFEDFMYRLRTHTGAGLVPMRDTLRHMVQNKDKARPISLVSDQAAGPEDRPYWTTFMHQEAGFYTSTERLAARFQCPVVHVSILRLGQGQYELVLKELYDGDAPMPKEGFPITESFVRHLEQDIRAAPAFYLWTHRRWKHKRPVSQ
ncbi:KDO2-lipid IV(A) lauroyltransferase [Hymenobacter gelipurpurascens]|uniref:KDO2-lipid IV(A) lauroyltransferase n=1 Tax=Hymenobacter gelipurpurascens TaxID=89968 RepID=A0A212TNK8_9BACT|nr:lysophospholipid acyltransferase family protein [Hymenobacter gelipurpurascens]SNC67404.1 KDO2-lipid IV(A) lauroyltransferase [Hymenobacter gelipurpurascens]